MGHALSWYVDLLAPITKSSVQALAAYAEGPDSTRLRLMLSPEGQVEYKRWHSHSRNLLEVLEEFPSVMPPLGETLPHSFKDTHQVREAVIPSHLPSLVYV